MSDDTPDRTRLIRSATRRPDRRRPVNPPVERGSTLLNVSAGALRDGSQGAVYGIEGLAAQDALRAAVAELERAQDCVLTPTGLAAVTVPLLALTRPGDEVLTTDALYGPTRRFLNRWMAKRGVTCRYHPADASSEEIIGMISDRTRVVFIESPGSLTFEMVDVPAMAEACRARGVLTVMDNTWAAGLAFKPLQRGVDVSVQALTKYAGGHSDLMMGAVSTIDPAIGRTIYETIEDLGWFVSPDDAWLALRGLRTLPLRYAEHGRSGLMVAEWLKARPDVADVFYPPLPGAVGRDLWRRDFNGAAGLLSFTLKNANADGDGFLDALELFGLGYSWGGYESLATHETGQMDFRLTPPALPGPLIRLHIGLEHPDDLIADLERAFASIPV